MVVRLDIGCGPNKESGFTGIDRFAMPGVDIVTDLNRGIPLASDSVDLIYASHSLEHLEDLNSIMQEIFRVCRHGAQICIVAPYNEQKLNFANPYHKIGFNEHTPRFWTNHPYTPLDPEDYFHPQAVNWPLGSSDHADLRMDFRLLRMEFFYFPRYRSLNDAAKRALRSERSDICDQIMYHLIAWKSVDNDAEFGELVSDFVPFAPGYIIERRSRDAKTFVPDELVSFAAADELFGRVQRATEQLALAKQEVQFLRSTLDDEKSKVANLEVNNQSLRELYVAERARNEPLRLKLCAADALLEVYADRERELVSKVEAAKRISSESARSRQIEPDMVALSSRILDRLNETRSSRWLSLTELLGLEKEENLPPALAELWTFSNVKAKSAGFRLQVSDDLRKAPYREYMMTFELARAESIELGVLPLHSSSQGFVGVEMVSRSNEIVDHVLVGLGDVKPLIATKFRFSKPLSLQAGWRLRVFASAVEVPVAVFELQRRRPLMRSSSRRPFLNIT